MAVLMYCGWNNYTKTGKEVTYHRDKYEPVTQAYKAAMDFIENFEKEYLDDENYEYGLLDISGSLIIQWICDKGSQNNCCSPVYIEIC